jgi:ribosomal protein S18 acetylase RimI-like enzyme
MDIRVLRPSDIPHVQLANITNLPENYFCKYYLYHAMSWPQLSYVAVDVSVMPWHVYTICLRVFDMKRAGTGKRLKK